MVPAKFITGIITEYGIIKPKDIKKAVKKHHPWMVE
jgi:methylthioribose-1-phosphate isomerase